MKSSPGSCTCKAAMLVLALHAAPFAHAAADVNDQRLLEESIDGANWLRKSGNQYGQHFSPLAEINDSNVADIGIAWITELPVTDGIAGTPVSVDGVIYVGAAFSIVFAIDASDGKILWSFDPQVVKSFATRPRLSWAARANRGIAVGDGGVFVATADCRLIAVDGKEGSPRWEKTTCDPELGYAITDSPYYGGGKVFVGNAGSESGKKNRGYVSAYDARTGEFLWRFFIVPSANEAENTTPAMKMAFRTWSGDTLERFGGGGSNWNEMTYDPESRLLYFGTAGAIPYIHSYRSPEGGDALFTSSVLAVNADTGEYVWHYQTVPGDSWEYNATMNIVLADLVIGNTPRKTLLIAPKNGFGYVLDRTTGELLSAGKYARVTWASGIDPETGRPVMNREAEYWLREPGTKVLIWPNMWGAHSWNPMAFSPDSGLLYIPVIDVPTEVTYLGDGDFTDTLKIVTEIDGQKFSPGKLVAYDPLTQRPRWTVAHELPFNGGVLATAGNLVFQGDAYGHFTAYRATTGEKLWSMSTGSTIGAAAASYALDDTQYVLLPVGAGGGLQYQYPEMHAVDQAQGPTRLIAFSLDGDKNPEMPVFGRRPLPPDQPKTEATTAEISAGEKLYSENCANCHGRDGVARFGGSVPDLRYAGPETHATWQGIVVGGARQQQGMPAVTISLEESELIRQYVLSLSEKLRSAELP